MLKTLYSSNPNERLHQDGLELMVLNSRGRFESSALEGVDAIVFRDLGEEEALAGIAKIRKLNELHLALMPILVDAELYENPLIAANVDGIWNQRSIPKNKLNKIQQNIERLILSKSLSTFKEQIAFNTLAYMFSRSKSIEPIRNRNSNIGFSYPYLSLLVNPQMQHKCLESIKVIENKLLAESKVQHKVNLCPSCSGSYLLFQETCTSCASIDLSTERVIHHFRCAYVGPESDFKKNGELQCPKCDKTLRHIGIDYDKPSEIHSCNSCGHRSQELKMDAACVDCGQSSELEKINTHSIASLEINSAGEAWLQSGATREEAKPTANKKSFAPAIFSVLLAKERKKISKRGGSSFLGMIEIHEGILNQLDHEGQKLLQTELLDVINSYLSEADILSSKSPASYDILCSGIENKELKDLEALLKTNLGTLLGDNLPGADGQVTIQFQQL